jgi:hypothetical protein
MIDKAHGPGTATVSETATVSPTATAPPTATVPGTGRAAAPEHGWPLTRLDIAGLRRYRRELLAEEHRVTCGSHVARARQLVLASLVSVEIGQELTTYRRALRLRLEATTSELVARYRDDPGSCLSALPGATVVPAQDPRAAD